MIEFRNVTFAHQYADVLLEDVSFCLKEGFNTILCDTQSGKTTLCRLMLGQLKHQGEVVVEGANPRLAPPSIVYLPQNPQFFANRSVLYNLQYPLRVRKLLKQNAQNVFNLAAQFGFEQHLHTKVKKLCKEQQLQLAVVRGLTVPRNIVLLDDFPLLQFAEQAFVQCKFGKMTVLCTSDTALAKGHTVVLDGKKVFFEGEAQQAQQAAKQLFWLSDKI